MAAASDAARADRAVELADRLLRAAQRGTTRGERRRQERLGRLVADPVGMDLVQRLTDEVLRLRRDSTAANRFASLVEQHGVPRSLGRIDRVLLASGARLARRLPGVVMPLVRRRIIGETAGLVNPAEDPDLARHIRRRTEDGVELNLNVLGEAILSDHEAEVRLQRVLRTLARPDVDYVSVKISALCAQLDVLAFEHSVDRICAALRRVYDGALAATAFVNLDVPFVNLDVPFVNLDVPFVNLDMEEYADLHLTVESFVRVLDEPAYRSMPAGIVLQAYLPDSHAVMERLGTWAAARIAAGGAPIKIRIVKGANLAMEDVDAEQHGWVRAPYATKAETDASYKRLLDSALRPEWADAVRIGVASHNLFEVAWALVLRDQLPVAQRDRMEIEMLEGMVPAQARAVREAAGAVLLYCPIVRSDEIEASLAYLARRFDENTTPENFLRAMFTMRSGSAEFREQEQRFRRSVADRLTVSTTPRRPAIERAAANGAFVNQPDSDMTDAATRHAFTEALRHPPPPTEVPVVDTIAGIDAVIDRAVAALPGWSARSIDHRARVLRSVADVLDAGRAGAVALMAAEAAKTVREGDPEVSEAVDFARYYASTPPPDGASPVGVVVVASPWNFPYAIPAGGVFAALMAGNTVILKPAPETRRTAWLLAQQCWSAGVPHDVLQFVACPDDEVGRRLITHPAVATVVLTGAHATAQLFLGWKPSLRLLAETSGKNAIVVTESADLDAAIRDIVRSAFGHAGQKCSAASLVIVEAAVHDDGIFLARLADAVRTLRVGAATDPATAMGPLIAPPGDALGRALTTLDAGESWLVEPRRLDGDGRIWSPGVRVGVLPGSWFHQTECFGPVLGVVRCRDLDEAIEVQNGTPFGLTGGIQSLDDGEVARWLRRVEIGNAYVNRHITGAIVRRQPFGGWKRSSVGAGPKAGGPHYVQAFTRLPAEPIDAGAAACDYGDAFTQWFCAEHDPTGLVSESNVLRYRGVRSVLIRAGEDTPAGAVDAAVAAARVCSVTVQLSERDDESDEHLADRLDALRPERLRLLTSASETLLRECHRLDVAVVEAPVSSDPHVELPRWLREQAISRSMHRYGRPRR